MKQLKPYSDRSRKKGFVLVELIVVIAVLGILATIAIPRFFGQSETAKNRVDYANARIMTGVAQSFHAIHDRYPGPVDGWPEDNDSFTNLDNYDINEISGNVSIQKEGNLFVYELTSGTVKVSGYVPNVPVEDADDVKLSVVLPHNNLISGSSGNFIIHFKNGTISQAVISQPGIAVVVNESGDSISVSGNFSINQTVIIDVIGSDGDLIELTVKRNGNSNNWTISE